MKETAKSLICQLTLFIYKAEERGYTNEQWFLDFEDNLNMLSTKDHNKIK